MTNSKNNILTSFLIRWWTFIRQRFPLHKNGVMVLFLYSANYFSVILFFQTLFEWTSFLVGFLLILSIFFRLRVFDEIKDYETDMLENPNRPLACGLISIKESRQVLRCLFIFEIICILLLSYLSGHFQISFIWLLTAAFTLLMYKEFFIGDWLRPKMEIYAISHTFSVCLIGLLIYTVATTILIFNITVLYLILANWAVFNVYEFARKTYSPEEDIENSDSYSKRHGVFGAILLSGLNVLVANFSLWQLFKQNQSVVISMVLFLILVPLITAIVFTVNPTNKQAHIYRNTMSSYILFYYLVMMVGVL